jgi:predicted anti-sigma-YlaC factor YlaD
MKCKEISAVMPDLAAGLSAASPEMNEHLNGCALCRGQFEEFRQTVALLDQWQTPEPSPYFDVRLMARIREEQAKPTGWLSWVRKPALVASLAVLMVMSVALFRTDAGYRHGVESGPVAALPGSAVGDLQALDKNSDLYSDFELLDDLQVQQDVSANP